MTKRLVDDYAPRRRRKCKICGKRRLVVPPGSRGRGLCSECMGGPHVRSSLIGEKARRDHGLLKKAQREHDLLDDKNRKRCAHVRPGAPPDVGRCRGYAFKDSLWCIYHCVRDGVPLRTLNKDQQKVIIRWMREFQGLTYCEIAEAMGYDDAKYARVMHIMDSNRTLRLPDPED